MTLPIDFAEARQDEGFKELAGLLATGFLRLSRTPQWRNRIAETGPIITPNHVQKKPIRGKKDISLKKR